MSVTMQSLVKEVVDGWRDEHDSAPDVDYEAYVYQNATESVPCMTTTLFQMVVDDNSLAFLDADEETDNPFTALSSAIRVELERRSIKEIETILENERTDKENSDG